MLKYTGRVNSRGKLIITAPMFAEIYCPSLTGKMVTVTIGKAKKQRSLNQNAYYFACVVPIFQNIFNQLGNQFSREQTHDILRAKFLVEEIADADGVLIAQRIKSTTELTTTQFAEYILDLQKWATEQFDTYIHDPNEQITINDI